LSVSGAVIWREIERQKESDSGGQLSVAAEPGEAARLSIRLEV
jgi:hypothetical protein